MPVHDCMNVTRLTVHSFLTEYQKLLDDTKFSAQVFIDFVVVDNASNQETKEYLACLKQLLAYPNLTHHLITLPENLGVSKSYNEIFKIFDATKGQYCIMINNDIVFSRNWLQNLMTFIDDFPEAGIISSHVIDNEISDETKIKWFGDFRKGEIGPISDEWYNYVEDIRKDKGPIVFEGVHGCLTVITRACRDAVGDYDEGFKIGCWDDVDYSTRTERAGFQLCTTHNAVIFHHGGFSQNYVTTKVGQNYWVEANKQYFMRKYNIASLDGVVCSRSLLWTHPAPCVNLRFHV